MPAGEFTCSMADDTARLLQNHNADSDSRSIQDQGHPSDVEHNPDDGVGSNKTALPHSNGIKDLVVNSVVGDGENTEEEKARPPMTLVQKLTFVGIAIAYLTVFTSFSVLAPFFPYEAEKKGVTSTETGLVFGIYSLVGFIACPVCGKYLPAIGGKFMFLSGSFVSAGCNILFGFLDKIEDKTTFLVYCFVIRTVEAVGSAGTFTAGLALCANGFPDNVAQISGFLELFLGLGFAVGPPLGSLFYEIGGYKLPFLVLGCTAIAFTILNMFIIPSSPTSKAEDERPGSVIEVLKIPAIWVVLITTVWGSACYGFLDPTLSLHLTSPPINLKPSLVGVMFLLFGGTYALFSPGWGFIADKKRTTRLMMTLGNYFTGISFLLVGPSPLLNLPGQLWIIIISLALFGFASALVIMPAFLDLLISAKWYGHPDDLKTQSIISGLFNSAYSLGSFLGPTAGGAIVDQIGFNWSSTYIAGGCFVIMIMLCLFGVWEYPYRKGRRKPSHMKNASFSGVLEPGQNVVNA